MACAILTLSSCTNDDDFLSSQNRSVEVMFRPTLSENLDTRALIGDASGIDQLVVAVYEGNETLSKKYSFTEDWSSVKSNGLSLTLIEGREYKILFWAENKENSAYEITDDGNISVDYSSYTNGGFTKMEEMDAFCAVSTIKVGTQKNEAKAITLSRPFAQLNFADKQSAPSEGTDKAVVTFHTIPTSYNPFKGSVAIGNSDVTFTFTDFPDETLSFNETTCYYVSSNYLFTSATGSSVEVTLDLQKTDGTSINKFEFKGEKAIVLEQNKKTNMYGNILQSSENEDISIWTGEFPTESPLTLDTENRYIIDEANDIAWLSKNGSTLSAATFLQTVDIDMGSKEIGSVQLPAGSIYDGGGKQIKNYANSLFGNANEVSVKNLTVDNISVSAATHVGVLMNTLSGSATFENVTVTNSTATTTNGAAGAFVGYISRKVKDSRSEPLSVTFDNCAANKTTIDGNVSEGHFVGLLRGYDNGETLTFNNNCTTAEITSDYTSLYSEGNEGAWLSTNDYSQYNGWLGKEECYRATVMYGANRFIPRWDGATRIAPLTDGSTKLIYSAFDLANCAGTNPGTIKFMEHVDMGAKVFNPLTNISKLLGEGKTIYNLKVETTFNTNSWDGGGFIRRCSAATIENITFKDADVRVTHVDGSDGDAYASIVCGTAEGTNTITNVKVIGGKLYGCNKMGGIAGYITGTFTATNCIVDGLSIENYDSGGKDNLGFKANGEVGGAFGFIAANSTISGCYVKNTTLNCKGVNNGRVLVLFKYAGRHVNEFIGDIRTTSGQKIEIFYDASNFTGNTYKNRKDQYSGCKYIGHCYYTSIATIKDTKGTVYVNGSSITVAQNY